MDNSKHFESLYPEEARDKEIGQIIDYVKAGKSCQLIGLPGTGRSNLLGLLSYNKNVRIKHLQENNKYFHFVYMDFSEVRKRPLPDVIKFILVSTAYSLLERNLTEEYEAVNGYLKGAVGFQDEIILFQGLKKSIDYLATEKELTVVFLFDRFEQYVPNITEEFFLDLKILRNRAKYRFACVFSQNRLIEDILEPSFYSEFYEFFSGNTVYLDVHDVPGLEFRFSYLEKVTGKKADEKTKKEMVTLTGGHGKLSRLAYEAVLSEESAKIKDQRLKSSEDESILKEFLLNKNTVKGALFEIWSQLAPVEQHFLKDGKIENEEDEKAKHYLENLGLFKNNEISISIFKSFVDSIEIEKQGEFSYDAERNEILKGGKTITDILSPSEFRLLRFLIQNPDRVCEKDEVISSVWKDTKTQEGVTDQALDQIVYRLRKKIEDDPNSPLHIQTVKGRGFKFSP